MVRLTRNFAGVALAAALLMTVPHAQAQSNVPGPTSAPVTSSDVMHWTADPKNGVRPATPAGQPAGPALVPQPAATGTSRQPSARTTPPPQALPAPQAAASTRTTTPAPQQPVTASRRRSRKTAVAEPPPPPPTPTPEQLPPNPPEVRFQNGELTINAQNSTLSQVLRAVQTQTGASVDMPAGAGSERVVAQIGPGPAHDVLNTLLNGSRFDYVILGVAGNPGAVQKVILTPRQGAAPASTATAQNNPTPQPGEAEPDEGVVAEGEPEYQNQNPEPPPAPPPGGFRRPMIPVQPPDQQQQSFSPDQQSGGKTPEQLMQELQQIQQQQQQYQEQLNPANRQPQQ